MPLVSATPTVAPQLVPIGPAGDEAPAAPSILLTEEAAQPERIDSTTVPNPVVEVPVDTLPAVIAEPELVTDACEDRDFA